MPSSTKAQGLRDYNEVSQRVEGFNEQYPTGRIVTTVLAQHIEVEDVVEKKRDGGGVYRQPLARGYVTVRAEVYRSPESTQPDGVGHSTMLIPGITQYTRDSELENAETSAVGRALAFIGFYAKGESLASKQEIAAKAGGSESSTETRRSAPAGTNQKTEQRGLTDKQKGLLFSRLHDAGFTDDTPEHKAQRKAFVILATQKRSTKDMTNEDLDKVLAILDAPDDESNAGIIALAKDVEAVGAVEED